MASFIQKLSVIYNFPPNWSIFAAYILGIFFVARMLKTGKHAQINPLGLPL